VTRSHWILLPNNLLASIPNFLGMLQLKPTLVHFLGRLAIILASSCNPQVKGDPQFSRLQIKAIQSGLSSPLPRDLRLTPPNRSLGLILQPNLPPFPTRLRTPSLWAVFPLFRKSAKQSKHSHAALYQLSNSRRNRSKGSNSEREPCPYPRCPTTARTARDIHRHIWTKHPQYADQLEIPSEKRDCPSPRCGHSSRKDNVSRHYKRKHGGSIKWKGDDVLFG